MLADGLTKALSKDKFRIFRDQIGLVNMEHLVKERKLRVITDEMLDEMEGRIPGGEVDII